MLARLEKAYCNKKSLSALSNAGDVALSVINELLEKPCDIGKLPSNNNNNLF